MFKKAPGRTLESFAIFPYIAWTLIIFLCIFVYKLSTELNSATKELDSRINTLESKVNQDTSAIKDFEK